MTTSPAPVLLVMEPGDLRDLFATALGDAGFVVISASSASDCIRVVREKSPSLIVMDQYLPDGDAWPVVRLLKGLSFTRRVPIIGLTADESRPNLHRALVVGCDAFLAKPCDADVLLEEVRKHLPQPGPNGTWAASARGRQR